MTRWQLRRAFPESTLQAITDSIRAELQKSGKVRFAVDAAAMQQQVEELERDCAAGQFERGLRAAIQSVGRLVGRHYPAADRNEQTDRPALL